MDDASSPIARAPTVGDEVYRRLRQQLLLGAWPPGARLREAALAERFGVSRTPVREAVRRLLQEGLLETRATQGVRVRRPDRQASLDAYDVRELLEGMAARQAAERASTEDRAGLEASLRRVESSADADAATQVEADLAFHRHVADLSGNEALQRALEGLQGHVTPLKVHTRDQNAGARTRAQHRAVAAAIEAGDGAAAERAMREHVAYFRDLIAQRVENGDGAADAPADAGGSTGAAAEAGAARPAARPGGGPAADGRAGER